MRFVKGHGTENDFVLLPDPDGELELTDDLVRAVCDRRAGIGADGVLRVVLTAAVPEMAHLAGQARWFMDYRNADGSLAEMCGNGVRVYARYLVDAGYAGPGELRLATRGGVRTVWLEADGDVTVDMGAPVLTSAPVTVAVGGRSWPGSSVSMGNPHVVVAVENLDQAGPLLVPPAVEPAGAEGTNVEFVEVYADRSLRMRVHERGVGETRSCGTGACAAAVAVAGWQQAPRPATYDVDVAGGRLVVQWTAEGTVLLTGPAVLVGQGELRADWLSRTLPSVSTSVGVPA
ncbi:MAG: diaminopimelate epimerase [Actinomycetota bacterium]|nr:diaminopimelate epimerase [Actinomycetota bacterium]